MGVLFWAASASPGPRRNSSSKSPRSIAYRSMFRTPFRVLVGGSHSAYCIHTRPTGKMTDDRPNLRLLPVKGPSTALERDKNPRRATPSARRPRAGNSAPSTHLLLRQGRFCCVDFFGKGGGTWLGVEEPLQASGQGGQLLGPELALPDD